jgi:membrane-associated protease RseP (regulator of RpoE activity)
VTESITNDAGPMPADPDDRPQEGEEFKRRSPVGLAFLAALVLWALSGGGLSLVAFIFALVLMIFLHELGHFITAKLAGMKVTEFFLGFGPSIWSFHRGETEYGIKALPLGAYVKIVGMTRLDPVEPGDEGRTYWSKPYWRRLSVAVAGSTMHFLMAIVLLWALLAFAGGVGGTVFPEGEGTNPNYDVHVAADGDVHPAKDAGMQDGDKILAIDGVAMANFDEARQYIRARPDQAVALKVLRDGSEVDLNVTLARNPDATDLGYLGVSPHLVRKKENPLVAVPLAFRDFGTGTVKTFEGMGKAFSPSSFRRIYDEIAAGGNKSGATAEGGAASSGSSAGDAEQQRPQSLIGATRTGAKFTGEAGWIGLFAVLMQINLFVGFFNLLPMLPLDGGHVMIASYEKIRSLRQKGKPYYADVSKLMPLTYAVVAALLVVGFSLMYLDVLDIVQS